MAATFPLQPHQPQLLIDVSELAARNVGTGIQRVTLEVLRRLLTSPPGGVRVEPVCATVESGYLYARRFTSQLLAVPHDGLSDEPIDVGPGDVFLALDLQPQVVAARSDELRAMAALGVEMHSVVYDLLPIDLPWAFVAGAAENHERWLHTILKLGKAHCISATVERRLRHWAAINGHGRSTIDGIDSFQLGGDSSAGLATVGLSESAAVVLQAMDQRPSLLMVGTLEPRKGHNDVIDAFEALWAEGQDANLVITGRQGWMVEPMIDRLSHHPELDKRLFWTGHISDEYLELLYGAARALVTASFDEGFGLPIMEARQRSLPVVARDIEVFRELADNDVLYFGGHGGPDLVTALRAVTEPGFASHSMAPALPSVTWDKSVQQLLARMGMR